MPQENILSFAECLAKLGRVSKELTPNMVDAGTQTDILYLLTPQEKEDLDNEIKSYQKKASDASFENTIFRDELSKTKNVLLIETKAKEDAVVHNSNLQQLYTDETTDLKDNIAKLNLALDDYKKTDTEKEQEKVQLRLEIKTLSERLNQTLDNVSEANKMRKTLIEKNEKLESLMRTKDQENSYIKEQNKKVRKELDDALNVIKVNEEIKRKPEMKDAWTQTEPTYKEIENKETVLLNLKSRILGLLVKQKITSKKHKEVLREISKEASKVGELLKAKQFLQDKGKRLIEDISELELKLGGGKEILSEQDLDNIVSSIKNIQDFNFFSGYDDSSDDIHKPFYDFIEKYSDLSNFGSMGNEDKNINNVKKLVSRVYDNTYLFYMLKQLNNVAINDRNSLDALCYIYKKDNDRLNEYLQKILNNKELVSIDYREEGETGVVNPVYVDKFGELIEREGSFENNLLIEKEGYKEMLSGKNYLFELLKYVKDYSVPIFSLKRKDYYSDDGKNLAEKDLKVFKYLSTLNCNDCPWFKGFVFLFAWSSYEYENRDYDFSDMAKKIFFVTGGDKKNIKEQEFRIKTKGSQFMKTGFVKQSGIDRDKSILFIDKMSEALEIQLDNVETTIESVKRGENYTSTYETTIRFKK